MARAALTAGVCLAIATACNIESHEGDVNETCGDAGAAGQSVASGGSGGAGGGSAGSAAGSGSAGAAGGTTLPTCADIATEAECVAQTGCEPVYAGIDCSCGPDCACVGGEPNCVCVSFEFFECRET